MQEYIKINKNDNVAVALCDMASGTTASFDSFSVELGEDIPAGHKFSLCDIKQGDNVIKYGYSIGVATVDIGAGCHVHTHNIKTGLSDINTYTYAPKLEEAPQATDSLCFDGYKRVDGKVGIRNEIWIIPTVGCVNNVATEIVNRTKMLPRTNTGDIVAFPHPYGCSQMGDDQENTKKILSDLVAHPNAGAVLVLGLGCENCNIDELKKVMGEYDDDRVKFLQCQDHEDELEVGTQIIEELISYTEKFSREPVDVKHLIVGLKCGGSDGFSGITANPTVGNFSDLLISYGGATILTEVPEMFGAETILMDRCESEDTFDKTVSLINNFKEYFINHNQTIYENPSPGNKSGGISTLEDKALGCTQKSGNATVRDVLEYGDRVTKQGLNLLSSPGNDLVAATALAASGAHIVLFTTGRGTPFACPVPTMKISSNTTLSTKKSNWIDFDCGKMLADNSDLSQELFDYVLEIANGKQVKSEIMGYHDMAIFKQGVTL